MDAEPLFALLSTTNHQVVFGRRGTGKTHALRYLAQSAINDGDVALYVDLRTIGSNGSIYTDHAIPLEQRTSTLLTDVLVSIHDALLEVANDQYSFLNSPVSATKAFDAFADVIGTVRIVGETTIEHQKSNERSSKKGWTLSGVLGSSPNLGLGGEKEENSASATADVMRTTGQRKYYLQFGAIQNTLSKLIEELGLSRVWLLLDEWSEIPIALQPYLADMLRRTILPTSKIIVKIAAIEHRCNFMIPLEQGAYIGIELGADAGADLNLDDFMVFDNDSSRSVEFFKSLIFKHLSSAGGVAFLNPDEMVQSLFKQFPVFEEFARASEGVPRDAIYLISQVARAAFGDTISVNHVRSGARQWYSRDKSSVLKNNPELSSLLNHIIDDVIGHRRARAFLLQSDLREDRIDRLFDSRLLHVLKKNVSDRDNPGRRYDVYKLDYGCYVDLINTTKAPLALMFDESDSGGDHLLEVPPDDYRSIRRAVLDLSAISP